MRETYDYIIAGAGFSGLVLAERLGAAGQRCLVVEKRDHIGGNCHDRRDRNGLLYHVYGPHYFRTNSEMVRTYLSRFTAWREVVYRVQAFTRGEFWSFPVNLATYRQLTRNPRATEEEFKSYLQTRKAPITDPANSREAMLAIVGEELYELFYRGYTAKQWGRPAEALDASVCRRIPVRTGLDDRYFQETFQALPSLGYTPLFENLLEASGADLRLSTDYREILPHVNHRHLIYTGPVDEYFSHRHGALPYRTLRFQLEELNASPASNGFAQSALQINYPGAEPFTRTVEVKHVTGEVSGCTNIMREFPAEYQAGRDEAYYPIPSPESQALANLYRTLADAEPNVTFVGRLAQYRYLNMDQVVAGALTVANTLTGRRAIPSAP